MTLGRSLFLSRPQMVSHALGFISAPLIPVHPILYVITLVLYFGARSKCLSLVLILSEAFLHRDLCLQTQQPNEEG